jgi:GGDEF domain-containing protein
MSATSVRPFVERVGEELQRAERYRIFVSLVVLDLDSLKKDRARETAEFDRLVNLIKGNTRSIDSAALVNSHKMAVLLPETPRQGAEIAARRVTELIRQSFPADFNENVDQVIPLEMASFPDAAGAKTVKEILGELTEVEPN